MDEEIEVIGLSAEELRHKLYKSLKEKGVVTSLKSQLRCTLLNELTKTAGGKNFLPEGSRDASSTSKLVSKAIDSLIVNHLQACNLEYSLSVYVPERGIDLKDLFGPKDLCRALGIAEKSNFYRALMETQSTATSGDDKENCNVFYELCNLMGKYSLEEEQKCTETSCQTVGMVKEDTIDAKLQEIEDQARLRSLDAGSSGGSVQEKLNQYQKRCEERYKRLLDAEIKRIKDRELSAMRLEESSKYRAELSDMRTQYEREYAHRYERLRIKEEEFLQRQRQKEQEESTSIYNERQKLLRDLENMKLQQEGSKKEMELDKKHVKADEDRVKTLRRELEQREQEVKSLEGRYEQKFKDKCSNFELEFRKNNENTIKEMEEREHKIAKEEAVLEQKVSSHQILVDEISSLKYSLKQSEEKTADYKAKVAEYDLKLVNMGDYEDMKRENIMLIAENQSLKTSVQELKNEVQLLEHKTLKPPDELISLREEYQRAKEDWNSRNASFHIEYNALLSRYQMDAEKFVELKDRYDFDMVEMKELKKEIADLRLVLHQTQNALALELQHKEATGKRIKTPSLFAEDELNEDGISPDKKRCSSRISKDSNKAVEDEHTAYDNIENSFRESDKLLQQTEQRFSEINTENKVSVNHRACYFSDLLFI